MIEQQTQTIGRVWLPYAVTGLAGLVGYGLAASSGEAGVAIMAAIILLPGLVVAVAFRIGRPILGADQPVEVAYLLGCLFALAMWSYAAALLWWLGAGTLAPAVAGVVVGLTVYGPGRRVAALSATAGVAAGALLLLVLNPLADPNPLRWLLAWVLGTTAASGPIWARKWALTKWEPQVDLDPLLAGFRKHLGSDVFAVPGSVETGAHGRFSFRMRLSGGRTLVDVQRVLVAVESELGSREGALLAKKGKGIDPRRDEVTVIFVPKRPALDEHRRPNPPASITEPVSLGELDNGEPAELGIYDDHGAKGGVIGGRKGSGKSRAVATLMEGWTGTYDSVFMFADLSGGITSKPWEPCLYTRVTDVERTTMLFTALNAAAVYRASTLESHGWESWQPSPAFPAIVMLVDEAQTALRNHFAVQQLVEQLVQVDRKSGISVILVQPEPVQMQGISPTIRRMAGIRLCFGAEGMVVKWVLGDTPAGGASHVVFDFAHAGQFLGHAPGLPPIPGRSWDTDLARAAAVAKRHAERRPDLDAGTAEVLASYGFHGSGTAPAPAEGNGQGSWTEQDQNAYHAASDAELRAALTRLATQPGAWGQALPEIPDIPDPALGRLSAGQALHVAAGMLFQTAGTSPADIVRATGRSESWVHATLATWKKDGLVENFAFGRWRATADAAELEPAGSESWQG